MGDVKHVPGPWHFDPRDADFGDQCGVDALTPDGKMVTQEVCTLLVDDDDREQVKATARLIAAAPDLLAACEAAVKACSENLVMAGYKNEPLLLAALNQCEAAIAKAKGGNGNG